MGVQAPLTGGELTQIIAEGNPADAMRAQGAFDAVRQRMFGEPSRPPPLGRYMPIERIGQGGLGVVYSAYDPKLHRRVAIKLLRPARSTSDRGGAPAALLLREAQALASVSHPNVVSVYDVGTARGDALGPAWGSAPDEELLFIVMELVEGPTLRQWLAEPPRSWRVILRTFEECARGLAAAHAVGLVHRDFKPGNVIVAAGDRPKVLDFGLARLASGRDPPLAIDADPTPAETPAQAFVSEAGLVLGTPPYMPPEQHRGADVDARSDQFAFCAALWGALYRERPYRADTMDALLCAKLAGPPPRPARSRVPAWVHRVLARGLAPDPADRFGDMAALSAALRRDRLQRARRIAAGAGIVAVVAGLAALNLEHRRREREACLAEPMLAFQAGARDRIRAAFVSTGMPEASTTADLVADRIDAFAEAWRAQRQALCDVDGEAGAGDDPVLRTACLDRQAEGMELLVAQLEIADSITVHRAVELAQREVRPADCASPHEVLPSDFFRATEERRTPEALRLDREIQRVVVLFELGKRKEALEIARRALLDAEQAGLPYLQARAQAQICRHVRVLGQHDRVEPECFRALELAEGVGSDSIAMNILFDVVHELIHDGNLVAAELAQRAAEGKLDRVDALQSRRSSVLRMRGMLEQARSDYPSALAAFERALELLADKPEFPDQTAVRSDIALVALALGDVDRAIAEHEHILAAADERVDAWHPERAGVLNNLGRALIQRGDLHDAERRLTEALAIKEHVFGRSSSTLLTTLANLTTLALARGDFAAATAALARADSIVEVTREPLPDSMALLRVESWRRTGDARRAADEARSVLERALSTALSPNEVAQLRVELGRSLLGAGDPEAAAVVLAEALGALEEVFGGPHVQVATALAELGNADIASGRRAEGVARLERAVELLARVEGQPLTRARVRFAFARALPDDRRDDARGHARAAADLHRGLGGPAEEILAVELWLAEHERVDP